VNVLSIDADVADDADDANDVDDVGDADDADLAKTLLPTVGKVADAFIDVLFVGNCLPLASTGKRRSLAIVLICDFLIAKGLSSSL
jgi:hypothetical protein